MHAQTHISGYSDVTQSIINMYSSEPVGMVSLRNEIAENNEIAAIREKFYQGRVLILTNELEQSRNELSFRRNTDG